MPLSDEEQAFGEKEGRPWDEGRAQAEGAKAQNRTAGGVTRATPKTHTSQTRWARWESPRLRDPQTHGLLCFYQPLASKSEHIINTHSRKEEKQLALPHKTQSLTTEFTNIHFHTSLHILRLTHIERKGWSLTLPRFVLNKQMWATFSKHLVSVCVQLLTRKKIKNRKNLAHKWICILFAYNKSRRQDVKANIFKNRWYRRWILSMITIRGKQ